MADMKIDLGDWLAKGRELFGDNVEIWRFMCAACGNVQSIESCLKHNPDLKPEKIREWIHFSCEGRRTPGHGCDWSLGGFLQIHKREVIHGKSSSPCFLFDREAA